MYVYVYVYVYVCVYERNCVYVCMCTCMSMCRSMCMCARERESVCVDGCCVCVYQGMAEIHMSWIGLGLGLVYS